MKSNELASNSTSMRAEVSEGVHPGWHEGCEVPGGGGVDSRSEAAFSRTQEAVRRRGPGPRWRTPAGGCRGSCGRRDRAREGAGGSGGQVGKEEAELGEGLLHLVHVDEAERAGPVGEGVGGDEGDRRRRLAGARGHLEQRVPACVKGALELPHVDRRVREVNRHAIQVEPHRGGEERAARVGSRDWEGRSRQSSCPRRRGEESTGSGMPAGWVRGGDGDESWGKEEEVGFVIVQAWAGPATTESPAPEIKVSSL
ncbi:hypothetical protein SETIT_8G189100v2 [Setaria italica]|uniref:Uncharacterized protein n=1 Tax=Setaria italica TaxID=4555 RepID=A0A368S9A8_SETIT|nr:hypothetical protein SETIT_8G189100v2 [Setaria italica]